MDCEARIGAYVVIRKAPNWETAYQHERQHWISMAAAIRSQLTDPDDFETGCILSDGPTCRSTARQREAMIDRIIWQAYRAEAHHQGPHSPGPGERPGYEGGPGPVDPGLPEEPISIPPVNR